MKLNVYCLVNERTHSMVRISAQRSDAEMVVEFLQVLVPYGLNINSATVYCLGTVDDELLEFGVCTRRRVEWSTTDYETSLPDGILRSLKKTGALPSDEPVVDADLLNQRLEKIEQALSK